MREALTFVGITMLATLLQAMVELDPSKIEDWRTWAVGVGMAVARAGARSSLIVLPLTAAMRRIAGGPDEEEA